MENIIIFSFAVMVVRDGHEIKLLRASKNFSFFLRATTKFSLLHFFLTIRKEIKESYVNFFLLSLRAMCL